MQCRTRGRDLINLESSVQGGGPGLDSVRKSASRESVSVESSAVYVCAWGCETRRRNITTQEPAAIGDLARICTQILVRRPRRLRGLHFASLENGSTTDTDAMERTTEDTLIAACRLGNFPGLAGEDSQGLIRATASWGNRRP